MMLIAPETLRWMRLTLLERGPSPWSIDAAGTCALALEEQCRTDAHGRAAERACVDLRDGWQATEVGDEPLSQEQLEDLARVTTGGDRVIVERAIAPILHCWIPNVVEIEAAERCRLAWNARAARLRDAGIDPWPSTTTDRPSPVQRMPRRVQRIGEVASASGPLVMHGRIGALSHRMLSILLDAPGAPALLEIHSEALLAQELTAHEVSDASEIAADIGVLVWRDPSPSTVRSMTRT